MGAIYSADKRKAHRGLVLDEHLTQTLDKRVLPEVKEQMRGQLVQPLGFGVLSQKLSDALSRTSSSSSSSVGSSAGSGSTNKEAEGSSGWQLTQMNPAVRINVYKAGDHFAVHRDAQFVPNADERSVLSTVLYLNDNFEGGETVFYFPREPKDTIGEFKFVLISSTLNAMQHKPP